MRKCSIYERKCSENQHGITMWVRTIAPYRVTSHPTDRIAIDCILSNRSHRIWRSRAMPLQPVFEEHRDTAHPHHTCRRLIRLLMPSIFNAAHKVARSLWNFSHPSLDSTLFSDVCEDRYGFCFHNIVVGECTAQFGLIVSSRINLFMTSGVLR